MSIIKRVRKKLDREIRADLAASRGAAFQNYMGSFRDCQRRGRTFKAVLSEQGKPAATGTISGGKDYDDQGDKVNEKREVKVLATGRAMEKALEVAAWFARQPDSEITIRSGSMLTMDEVEYPLGECSSRTPLMGRPVEAEAVESGDVHMEGEEPPEPPGAAAEEGELDSIRLRYLTYLEIGVSFRA